MSQMVNRRWSKPRLVSLCLLLVCALVTGTLAALLGAGLFTASDEEGRERAEQLALYWSRYMTLLLENGKPASLDQLLMQDIPAYPGQNGFHLTVKDQSGGVIFSYSNLSGPGLRLHKAEKSYLESGELGGSIAAEVPWSSRGPVWPRLLLTGGITALMTGGALLLQQLMGRRRLAGWADYAKRSLEQAESSAGHSLAAPDSAALLLIPHNPEEVRLQTALHQSAALITQLQTARKTMVAEVAHELRTPLTVVRAALDNALYENEALAPERLAVLAEQVTAMSSLVQDLQDLTLAESGSLRLEKIWFTPAETAGRLVELFAPEAEEKGIHIRSELDEEARLYADERRFRQLLLNLLGNAIRHARSRIDVRLTVSQAYIELTVKDDGWGMEQEEAQALFQRYYRKRTYADGSPAPRGVGLGLAVVKGIAEAHGGLASATSRFGEGALFTVRLPLFRE